MVDPDELVLPMPIIDASMGNGQYLIVGFMAWGDRLTGIPIGIVVCSDRAAAGTYQDRGGPAIAAYLDAVLVTPWRAVLTVIRDERALIAETLLRLADQEQCALILTTGGTGPAPRDVTPEATTDVCERLLPGFGEAMRAASLVEVPTAILSRQFAGTRGKTLIINLPGKPDSIKTCLDAVFAAVPYCIDLMGGPRLETDPEVCRAFRPAMPGPQPSDRGGRD